MIRVCRCEDAERGEEKIVKKNRSSAERFPFPVFVIVCTKFKKMERISPLIEYCPNESSTERLSNIGELTNRIQTVQHFATLCHQMSSPDGRDAPQDVFIELMDPKSGKKAPKYSLFVVDRLVKSANNKFAAFVVPQGR